MCARASVYVRACVRACARVRSTYYVYDYTSCKCWSMVRGEWTHRRQRYSRLTGRRRIEGSNRAMASSYRNVPMRIVANAASLVITRNPEAGGYFDLSWQQLTSKQPIPFFLAVPSKGVKVGTNQPQWLNWRWTLWDIWTELLFFFHLQ